MHEIIHIRTRKYTHDHTYGVDTRRNVSHMCICECVHVRSREELQKKRRRCFLEILLFCVFNFSFIRVIRLYCH